jgi:taurine transport system ATP-binding protein
VHYRARHGGTPVALSRARHGGTPVALSKVDLTIARGDFVVALGASGCGKSTLLATVAGFLRRARAMSGSTALVRGPGADRGVVFQRHAPMPWLNAVDNVAFGLKMRGGPGAERRRRGREQLAL